MLEKGIEGVEDIDWEGKDLSRHRIFLLVGS